MGAETCAASLRQLIVEVNREGSEPGKLRTKPVPQVLDSSRPVREHGAYLQRP
jgi:hypothetical protein